MSLAIKLLIISISINIFLTLAGISVGDYDMLNKFIEIDGDSISPTDSFSLTSNNSVIPTSTSGATGLTPVDEGYSFVDTIKLVFGFMMLLLVALFFPVYWAFALALPLWLSMILFLLTLVGITSIIFVIRGTGS